MVPENIPSFSPYLVNSCPVPGPAYWEAMCGERRRSGLGVDGSQDLHGSDGEGSPALPSQMLSFSVHAHALGFLKWLRPKGMEFQAGQLFKPSQFKLSFIYL